MARRALEEYEAPADIDSMLINGRKLVRQWADNLPSGTNHLFGLPMALCGPTVSLTTIAPGTSAAIVAAQPTGLQYRRSIIGEIMR